MDKSFHPLDQHFNMPQVRHVEASRPFRWLAMGMGDMRDNLVASLSYGLFFAVLGYLILAYAADMPYLFTAAESGFFLVGPLAAAGLYEISRRPDAGRPASFADSQSGLREHSDGLAYFGVFLAIALIGCERISAILFALFYQGSVPDLANFYSDVFLSGDYLHFVVAYMVDLPAGVINRVYGFWIMERSNTLVASNAAVPIVQTPGTAGTINDNGVVLLWQANCVERL